MSSFDVRRGNQLGKLNATIAILQLLLYERVRTHPSRLVPHAADGVQVPLQDNAMDRPFA